MLETFQNIFRIPELRKKIYFTLGVIFIYRLGGHIPTPGIDPRVLGDFFAQSQNALFGLWDMFVGGAFKRVTVFALGIMPYISASIIIQLLGTVFLYLDYTIPLQALREELQKILQASKHWDGKVSNVQVTNTTERTVEVRALMSAPDAGTLWNLRCEVREKLIVFVQKTYPQSLPIFRAELPMTNK